MINSLVVYESVYPACCMMQLLGVDICQQYIDGIFFAVFNITFF